MADPTDFTNSAFSSPQQVEMMRRYAMQLLEPIKPDDIASHWTGALAAALRGGLGPMVANRANIQEQASNRALQQGLNEAIQSKDLSKIAALTGNPRITPAHIAMLMGILEPRGTETYTTPGAAVSTPAQSILGGAGGATVPPLRPVTQGRPLPSAVAPTGEPARPGQQNLTDGEITGIQTEDIPPGVSPGDYVKRGFADAGITPMQKLENVQKKGQEFTRSNLMNVAGAEPHAAALKQDQTFSAQAPLLKQTVGAIRDDIRTHGSEISWGPQTETVTQLKRFVENYAPGIFTPEQIAGISAADNLQKMSGVLGNLLASQLGNQGGTDFSRQLGQGQVPNMHNSKEGALALADMIEQSVDQNRKLGEEFRKLPTNIKTDPNFDYIGWRQGFFNKNPIRNPITHNPITQDLLKMREGPNEPQAYGGGWGKVTRGQ